MFSLLTKVNLNIPVVFTVHFTEVRLGEKETNHL